MTAHEVWDFDDGQSLYSNICGSSYEAAGKTYLVDFANLPDSHAQLIGLDSDRNVVFDFQYLNTTSGCGAAWNAIPVEFENLQIN
jgi:arylsulfate sulfotransferase